MRFRNAMVAACLMAAAFATPMMERLAAQGSTGIVISEFRLRGATSINDEFIELFNASTASIPVGGWLIRASNSTGTLATRATIPAGVTIGPGCFYLVANNTTSSTGLGYNGSAPGNVPGNLFYTIGFADNGGVAVTRADLTIVDQVGHSASGFREGPTLLPVLTFPGNKSFERRPGGSDGHADTDNNVADFQEISPAHPQNASSTCLTIGNPIVTGSASPSPVEQGQIVTVYAQVTAGSVPPSTGLQVTGNLSAIGGSASQVLADTGVFPDLTANDLIFTTAVTVPVNNAVGPQSLPLTVTDAQGRSGNTVLSLTINPPAVVYLPHEIQGSGATSPLPTGTAVIVRGVVTARKFDGFFLQTEAGTEDADPATSEGLFVFAAGGAPPDAVVEHRVVVRGSVAEFASPGDPGGASVTGLNLVTAVTDLGAATGTVPAPYVLTSAEVSANGTLDQLERFEGMRVTASLTAITGTGGNKNEANAMATSDGTFFAVLTGQARPFREPGVEAGYPVLPCAMGPCHVPTFDGNPERLRVDSDALEGTAAVDVSSDAVMTDVTGVLDFGFRTYTLLPEATLTPAGGLTAWSAPPAAAEHFTIASFNMDRFFDTVNDPGPDVVLTPQAFERRLAKASLAIRVGLSTPDVIGLQEVEKLTVLNDLATRIDLDAAVVGMPAPHYSAILVEGADPDGLDVGFLVKTAGGRVSVSSTEQVGAGETFVDPTDNSDALLHERPPLVLRALIQGPATSLPQSVTVIVNHLTARTGVELNNSTGGGERVRAQRQAQAEFLANYIQGRQLNDPNEAIVSIGNYNAFGFNDGYVDSIGTILGTPAPEDQVVLASLDLVEPDLVDLANFTAEAERYSSLSGGNAQALDHAIVTANLVAQLAGFIHPRFNADFAEVQRNNPLTAQRTSDRDPAVAYFFFPPDAVPPVFSFTPEVPPVEATGADGAIVTYDAPTATDNLDGDVDVVCEPASGATHPLGNTGVTCTAADAAGNVASVSFTVTVQDSAAPNLTVPGDITAEASSSEGHLVTFTASATDDVTGPPLVTCTPVSGTTFAIGATTVTCEATDGAGNSSTGTFTVTVQDTTAPQLTVPGNITAQADSPAGKLVTFAASATDAVTASPVVTCTPASGTTFGLGVTTVTCDATDGAGNSSTGTFTVTVQDTTAPQLTVPADIAEQATSSAGKLVTFDVTATDAVTTSPVVTCAPASGTTFPIGVTMVNCSATDAAGNSATESFAVTITATVPGRMHGAGTIGSNAARMSFRLDVRESAAAVDSGSFVLKIGANDFAAEVSDVVFANPFREPRPASDSVTFSGFGSWNGHAGYAYQATASDRGEPGRDHDTLTFVVHAPDGTVVASGNGTLTSGNIQSLR